jgi:GT2 family glycosyltransferase
MELETIVCDNASADESPEMVRRDFPEVILISNKKNIGFGKANNICFQKCTQKYILIANPDIVVNEAALANLKSVLESDSSIGAVGALLLNGDGVPQKHYYRKFPNLLQHIIFQTILRIIFLHIKFLRYRIWEDNTETEKIVDVDQPPGACIFIRRDLLNHINGFDERFDLFYEDVDLCRRIKNAGYRIVMNPAARIIHSGQKSLNKELPSNLKHLFFQSGALYFSIHKGDWQAFAYKIIYIVDDFLKIVIRTLLYPFLPGKRVTLRANIANSIIFIKKVITGERAVLP